MNHVDITDRIWTMPLEELPTNQLEIKLGLYQTELIRLRDEASRAELQARLLRADEASTRELIQRARRRLGIADSPIPDFSREEKGHA